MDRFERARDLIAGGDFEGAMLEYKEGRSVDDERALCGRALVFLSRADIDGVIKCMTEIVSGHHRAAYPHGIAGTVMYEAGHLNESLECYNTMISLDPGEISAYVRKAHILAETGRNTECADAIKACMDAAWSGRESPKEVKRLHIIRDRVSSGAPVKFTSVDVKTFIPGLWELIETALGPGSSWRGAGDDLDLEGAVRAGVIGLKECEGYLDDLTESFPNSAAAWCMKAMLLADEDRIDEAIACYDSSIEANPGEIIAYADKCDLLADAGDRAAVLECMEKAFKAEPSDGESARLQRELRSLYESLKGGEEYPRTASFDVAAGVARWVASKSPYREADDASARGPGKSGLFPPGMLDGV